jgi:peptidoglycan-associated lipoprotein
MMRRLLAYGAWLLFLAVACGGPKWPNCDNDESCKTDGHTGVCVDGKCVECRSDAGCPQGQACRNGTCSEILGFCDDAHACSGGATCGKDHKCHPIELAREPVECDDDHPCKGAGEKCQNGHCVAPPRGGPGCTDFPAPKFDFESPELRADGKQVLQRLAQCMTTGSLKGSRVLLTGHCDNRGEYEFNMGLGAERAEEARKFLNSLGVPPEKITTSSRGKLDAVGTDETGWQNDRRVDVEVR